MFASASTVGKRMDPIDYTVGSHSARAGDEPDAHGQAALLLTESLIHMLVERSVIKNAEAIDVIRAAAEVKVEVAIAAGESAKRMKESLTLLARMQGSFEADQAVPWVEHLAARD